MSRHPSITDLHSRTAIPTGESMRIIVWTN
jgi:hypothetical protein